MERQKIQESLESLLIVEDWGLLHQLCFELRIRPPKCHNIRCYEETLGKCSDVFYTGPKQTKDGYYIKLPIEKNGQYYDASNCDTMSTMWYDQITRELHFSKTRPYGSSKAAPWILEDDSDF